MARENAAAATLASATPPVAKKSPASTSKATALLAVSVKTPFQLFCDDLRPSLTADNPRAGAVEIAKLLAAAWRDAPEEDKAIYTAQHQELRAEAKKAGNTPVTTTVPQPAKSAGKGKGKGARGKKRKGAPPEEEVAVEKEPEEPDSDDEDRRVRSTGARTEERRSEHATPARSPSPRNPPTPRPPCYLSPHAIHPLHVLPFTPLPSSSRQTCDWISHPPSFIISEDSSRDMYLVAREGLPLQEYGVVTASEAKAARLDGRESVLAAELIDGFEAFRKRFLADVHRAQDMGELDLERLDPSSTLEACAILVRRNGEAFAHLGKKTSETEDRARFAIRSRGQLRQNRCQGILVQLPPGKSPNSPAPHRDRAIAIVILTPPHAGAPAPSRVPPTPVNPFHRSPLRPGHTARKRPGARIQG